MAPLVGGKLRTFFFIKKNRMDHYHNKYYLVYLVLVTIVHISFPFYALNAYIIIILQSLMKNVK